MRILAAKIQSHLANYTTGDFQTYSEDNTVTIFSELNPNIFKPARIGIQIVNLPNPFFRLQIDVICKIPIKRELSYYFDIKKQRIVSDKKIMVELEKHPIFMERVQDIVKFSDVIGEIKFYTPPESTDPFTRVIVLVKDERVERDADILIDIIYSAIDIHQAICEINQKTMLREAPRYCWRCGAKIEGEGYYCPICGVKL